ncbi:MAG: GGDEF domain-containing phosphodiesterase [[Bacteroides] pectinophilus]|nr:GGDEF domain-containing phosphodiesterase [[Bacteroides] pectinophilus]
MVDNDLGGALKRFSAREIATMIPRLLYEDEYYSVALIDIGSGELTRCRMIFSNDEDVIESSNIYDNVRKTIIDKWVPDEEREDYAEAGELTTIIKNLDENGTYEFTIHHVMDGEVLLFRYHYMYFDKEHTVILTTMKNITGLEETDMVTGGVNRKGFKRLADRILKGETSTDRYAMMYIDLKSFKSVNEIIGFKGGDALLRYFVKYINNSPLKPLLTARNSSDHFACLVECKNLDYDRLADIFEFDFEYSGKSVNVYARCGICKVDRFPSDVDAMYDMAKLACENITNEYMQPYIVFNTDMSDLYIKQCMIQSHLPYALERNELQVFYQPIYDPYTEKIVEAEALIRWIMPNGDMVSPGLFLPTLEKNGHIAKVDYFVSHTVNRFIEDRLNNGKYIVPVTVNLSRMDFYDAKTPTAIMDEIIAKSSLRPYRMFEITESAYMSLNNRAEEMIGRMRSLGVGLLLDDFGSGFSSYGTIANYDFDIIKLDMQFIRMLGKNKKSEKIIRSIISMAHELGIKIVTEGAESKEQVEFLKECGSDYIQGYYFSRPIPQSEFEKLLDANN